MRDARQLKDVDIYQAVGMKQDFFSKSMSRKRNFTPAEREAIVDFFAGKANAEIPIVTQAIAELPLLDESDRRRVLDLIHRLRGEPGKEKESTELQVSDPGPEAET
jgi:hypothetical protein